MRSPARTALAEGWPVLLTSVVVGATYGVVARQAGLSVFEASASSFIVFAGASQFATLELLKGGAGSLEIAVAIALINARHALMAAAIRPFLSRASLVQRLGLGYVLTDEAFALGIGWFRRERREISYYVTFGVGLWACWNLSTIAGAVLGASFDHPERFGVDFAITAVFVAIVATSARHRTDLAIALAAAVVSGALKLAGASTLAVVVAGAVAPLLALRSRP
jgi:branched chain amino acid efflux pump